MSYLRSCLLALVIACGAHTARGEYALSITANQDSYTHGNAIRITATVTNASSVDGWIDFGQNSNDYLVEMFDSINNPLKQTAYQRRIRRSSQSVTIGGHMVSFAGRATVQTSVDLPRYIEIPGPGVYTVRLSRGALQSNLLELTVVPAPASPPVRQLSAQQLEARTRASAPTARNGLEVTISMDSSSAPHAGEVRLMTYLKNTSDRDITIPFSNAEREFAPDIRNADDESAPYSELMQQQRAHAAQIGMPPHVLKLRAGGGMPGELNLGQMCNLTSPGSYSVQIDWAIPKEMGGGQLRSNILEFTIGPAAPK